MRLLRLYLRARQAGAAVTALIAVGVLSWLFLWRIGDGDATLLVLTAMPLGAAAILGASTRSPFGEVEQTASRPLPWLRSLHITALLLLALLALTLADTALAVEEQRWVLVRNAAGFTGIALITCRLIGASFAWAPVVGLGLTAFVSQSASWWAWSNRPSTDDGSVAIAVAFVLLGITLFALVGARDTTRETS